MREDWLQITWKRKSGDAPGVGVEDVIRVVMQRLLVLDAELPSIENQHALEGLAQAMGALYTRTERRREQGVEGTDAPHSGKDD